MARALVLLRTTPDALLESVGRLARHQRGFRLAVVSAACVHAALVSMLSDARPANPKPWTVPASELVIELPEPERAPPPNVQEPAPMIDIHAIRAPLAQRPTATAAASPAARAGAVLTQSDDSEQALDFTDSIVTGTAVSYAGGITQAQGTSVRAVRRVADSTTSKPSSVSGALATDGDLSRGPAVLGGLAWNCPFPPAADADSVDHAQVAIRVEVDANGRPARVLVLSDPGHGFAAAARACALGKRWAPGADRSGRATASGINVNVRFVR